METNCSALGNGNGRRTIECSTLKMALVAPMPSARVSTAASVNPGLFRSSFNPLRRSKRKSASHAPTPTPRRKVVAASSWSVWYGARAARCYTREVKRALGNTGFAVGPIGLGGMPLSIQGRPDERTALAVIEAFVAGGGDHIDTAISYCLDEHDFGHNERLIAKALRNRGRSSVVVATKGGLTRPNGRWEVDCSPHWLRQCCEQSAATLGAPIALYYLHTVDPAVPLAESLGELVRLREEGKITSIGLSNVTARHLDEALRLTPIAAVQNR